MQHFWILTSVFSVFLPTTFATKKASCNGWTLTAPEEGDFSCNPPGAVISSPGTRCNLNCDTGYSAKHNVLVCSEKGGWVPTNSPECQVDSTMTLVIVLSIVASIMVIFGLSVLYAKTSKKCRGRRRRLDDDDPEVANKLSPDTSTYYDQVKKLQSKRRLHAKRQSRSINSRKKKRSGSEEKRKRSETDKLKRDKKRLSSTSPDKRRSKRQIRSSSKQDNVKRSTKDRKKRKQLPIQEKPRNLINDSQKRQKRKDKFEKQPNGLTPRNHSLGRRKENLLQNLRTILFCLPFREQRRERFKRNRQDAAASNGGVHLARKQRSPPTNVAISRVSSSSSSNNASSTNNIAPVKSTQAATKASVTSKKPPRPPPPKFSTLTSRARHRSANNSDNDENHKAAVSSGYSSEGGKVKQHTHRERQSKAEHDDEGQTSDVPNKRIEMMSYDLTANEKEDSNPYDHYPVAQSYRQYLDFENDYRRTTGDYHPQYDNIKVIPIQTAKRKKKVEKTTAATDKTPEIIKTKQGGMKYIDIGSKETDGDEDAPSKNHGMKNHKERYENPAARDKRANIKDRSKREKIKRSKDQKKAERESKKLNETKRAIADETIIVNGTSVNDASAFGQTKTPAEKGDKAKK